MSTASKSKSDNATAPRLSALQRRSHWVVWILLTAALAFSFYVRWRLRASPFERDEGEYAYIGQQLLQGIPPFKLAYSMKLPGTSMVYAAMMAVFGQTDVGIHVGFLCINLATIVLSRP